AVEDVGLEKPVMDYFKMLYADTALNGEIAPTRCGLAFFGTSSCLFATDAPFDAEQGRGLIANTIKAVEALPISAAEREKIFTGNARSLLKLPARTTARAPACRRRPSGSSCATARWEPISRSRPAPRPAPSSPSWKSGA